MLEKLRYDGLEHGGAIGADASGMVTHIFLDIASHLESYSYTPSVEVAKVIQKWVDEGISAIGFVHSHPNNKRNHLTQGGYSLWCRIPQDESGFSNSNDGNHLR